ncbi:MAG: ATP-binding protein [Minwuiales bacterium]|nr:ATP-binding protein [Minwuiales bacterium]
MPPTEEIQGRAIRPTPNGVTREAVSDAIIGAVAFLGLLIAFISIDFVEFLFEATRAGEAWELDELIAAIPALALVGAWYSLRRWFQVSRLNRSLRAALADAEAARERQRVAEAELREAQKMEALGRLAGALAHELSNMLQPIVTLSKLSLERDALPDKAAEGLRRILDAAENCAEIAHQALAFSGGKAIRRTPTALTAALSEAVAFAASSLPATVQVQADISDDPGLALIDRTELTQVVTNLLNNAADAVGGRGRIDVCLDTRTVRDGGGRPHGLPGGRYFQITVTDDGPGMTEETRAQAFEPFFTTKAAGGGTGLGLAVVYGIVTGWGGSISAASNPGGGARFEVLVPRMEPQPAGASSHQSESPMRSD